ncbi:MAG TPA: polyprenyl synthetase family protein [Microthrixaceae bacterium]|nr:polyprenyl synthetase family protein [Microthrixaceae bacterium]
MTRTNPLQVMPTMTTDLARLEAELTASVKSDNAYLTEISTHLISAGGKRVRPGFTIASAAVAHPEDRAASNEAITGGIAVELVHLGSLYHDDVMDEAAVRRTVDSVNARWGNLKAILAGDYLLARASELAASLGVEVAGLLANTIARLCEGQLLELQHSHSTDRTEDLYLRSIDGKTASLLAASCRIGGLVAELPRDHVSALSQFGYSYGMAFQIVDDILDLVSDEAAMGKPTGHDIEEGVYTLPVIVALAGPDGDQLRSMLNEDVDDTTRDAAALIVRNGDGIPTAIEKARSFADSGREALASLPPSPGVTGLHAAADYLLASVEAAAS